MFGNEPGFHSVPIPYRGLRKHEVEVLSHPPGYQHPIIPRPTGAQVSNTNTNSSPGDSLAHPLPDASPSRSSAAVAATEGRGPTYGGAVPGTAPKAAPWLSPGGWRSDNVYLSDQQRLNPHLTVNAALQAEQELEQWHRNSCRNVRRERTMARDAAMQASRDAAFEKEQQRLSMMTSTSLKNREQDDRDPITHQCYTAEAEQLRKANEALTRERYAARQRSLETHMNSTAYNILTWQPR